MRKFYTNCFLLLLLLLIYSMPAFSQQQNALLVNLGSSTCSNPDAPTFGIINNPLTTTPSLLADCNLQPQLINYQNAFIAYNPVNNEIYVADITTPNLTKIWILNVGLPDSITCPATIPVTPTFLFHDVLNNFEFDKNGNLWAFGNYNLLTGTCTLSNVSLAEDTIISSTTVQFPAGHYPTNIGDGDIVVLPDGRIFTTLGASPSQLYEITNYIGVPTTNATYLQTMPANCYGIANLNGNLEVSGTDFASNCYYYEYNIANNTLSTQRPFQDGLSPIDNTAIVPAVGATKQLVNVTPISGTIANVTYEIYVKNMGNVILNNINATDNLGTIFGAGNVSNVTVSFVPGANNAGLALNPNYDGVTDITLLAPGQQLPNQILTDSNYYFEVVIKCTINNLEPGKTYYNTAITSASIGSGSSLDIISDSSNNGPPSSLDPNNNNSPADTGENTPTPLIWSAGLIPCNNGKIYVPNAFTPNEDAPNNVFKILTTNVTDVDAISIKKFEIFNRWGQRVFSTTDVNQGWDGVFNGQIVPDNYVYYITYGCIGSTTTTLIKGNVLLIK